MSVRWHRSPSVDLDNLRAIWFNGYPEQASGFVGSGNAITVAASLMYPVGSAPGAVKAFKFSGATSYTLSDGEIVLSDPLGFFLPARTQYRVRSFVSPSNGFVPFGAPGMTQAEGHLSGFMEGTADQSVYADGQADSTQLSTGLPHNGFSDMLFEPFIIGRPSVSAPCVALFGDSLTYGVSEVGVGVTLGATVPNAGDQWGNKGWWERACDRLGYEYVNLGVSGAQALTWATDGRLSFPMFLASECCNRAVIALGTNDALNTPTAVLDSLDRLVRKARTFTNSVTVATLPPRTAGLFSSAEGQVVDAVRTPVINAVNDALRAGKIEASLVDIHSIVRDPLSPEKWRSDGEAWTHDGAHASIYGVAQTAALVEF